MFSEISFNVLTNLSIDSCVKFEPQVILNLGVLKGHAGATTGPTKKPLSFNLWAIANTLKGSSLYIIGKIGYPSTPQTSNFII